MLASSPPKKKAEFFSSVEEIEIPKIIHVIWVGDAFMPQDGIRVVSEWSKANPSFTVYLWGDMEAYKDLKEEGKPLEETVKNTYQKLFRNIPVMLPQQNTVEKDLSSTNNAIAPIIIKDFKKEGLFDETSRYEMFRLDPNGGARSDRDRYKLLLKFGGMYVDCRDVNRGPTSLEKSGIFGKQKTHMLYLDHRSQENNSSKEELENFDLTKLLNNDVLISTKNNPFFKKLLKEVDKNYNFEESTPMQEKIRRAYGSFNRFYLTLQTTGGNVISKLLKKYTPTSIKGEVPYYQFHIKHELIELRPIRSTKYSLVNSEENKLSWLFPVAKRREDEEALNLLTETILFELTHFKILRLEDHTRLLAQALDLPLEEAARILIDCIKKIDMDFSMVEVAQSTALLKEIDNFYFDENISLKTYFSLDDTCCIEVLEFSTNFEFLKQRIFEGVKDGDCELFLKMFSEEQTEAILSSFPAYAQLMTELMDNRPSIENIPKENLEKYAEVLKLLIKIVDKLVESKYVEKMFTKIYEELEESLFKFNNLKEQFEHTFNVNLSLTSPSKTP